MILRVKMVKYRHFFTTFVTRFVKLGPREVSVSVHPTADAFVADAEPVRLADTLDYFHAGGKPRGEWRVGAEFEKFALDRRTGRAITYGEPGGIRDILHSLAKRFGWRPHHEGDHLTALSRAGCMVSLEPGGQVEFSTPPVERLDDMARELRRHRDELRAVVDPTRIVWVAAGVTPFARIESIPLGPRRRHAVMAEYLPSRSPTALAMMKGTASTQATFDYSDEADAVRKFTVALKLGPLFNALLVNSEYVHGVPSCWASYRGRIWQGMDPDRSGPLVALLEQGLNFESYRDYLLDVPMLFLYRDGDYRPAEGRTFRDYLTHGIDGRFPTPAEWELHLTTVFPDVRLKNFLEVRGADATPPALALGVPAFWKGLLYDPGTLADADDIARSLPPNHLPALGESISRYGLNAEYAGRSVRTWATELLNLAARGLVNHEAAYLEPLREVANLKQTPHVEHVSRDAVLASLEY